MRGRGHAAEGVLHAGSHGADTHPRPVRSSDAGDERGGHGRAPGERGVLATALAKAGAWFIEPVEPVARPVGVRVRPAVAVIGLAAGCGTTVVARALATELARRDGAGAAMVAGGAGAGAMAPGGPAATRLARAIGTAGGLRLGTAGRLCLVTGGETTAVVDSARHLAPVVLDLGSAEPAGIGASLADHVVVVAPPRTEPALAAVVAGSLGRIGPSPMVLLNRVGASSGDDADRWSGRAAFTLSESRAGARLALAGRDARRTLGAAISELADVCELPRSEW